jgi:histidyl-tRNA synthetase
MLGTLYCLNTEQNFMKKNKPTLPQGTRDFAPEVMVKRNFILDTIKQTFQRFGFLPLETPAMENLDMLMGKYGEEGDKLIFRIFNSGELRNYQSHDFQTKGEQIIREIADRALRYDLTVPFARFVVMNQGRLTFPFKRYQIQPVWRGDSPQKGRYREFYQCDADVVGTDSLLCEAEIILMINEVLNDLGIKDFSIKFNNRKILTGIAEILGAPEKVGDLCVAIDKLDKIGEEKVLNELIQRGFSPDAIVKLKPILNTKGVATEKINQLKTILISSNEGQKGIEEVEEVLELVKAFSKNENYENDLHIDFDLTLARGLSYYTGAIFEVKVNNSSLKVSISGGGRYDNLTGTFGLDGVSGVGFSFGVDRIYDIMEELQLFPTDATTSTRVIFTNFDKESLLYTLPILSQFRQNGINSEIYPNQDKLGKQFKYANAKQIPYVAIIGSEEMQAHKITLKNMETGNQEQIDISEAIEKLKI